MSDEESNDRTLSAAIFHNAEMVAREGDQTFSRVSRRQNIQWIAIGMLALLVGVTLLLSISAVNKNTERIAADAIRAIVLANSAKINALQTSLAQANIVNCLTKKTSVAVASCLNVQPGAPGRPGLNGLPGTPGPAGVGIPGLLGKTGAQGLRGLQGVSGTPSTVPGPRGEPGINGSDSTVPGPAGKDGADGVNGTNGIDGAQGPVGPAGPAGPASTVPGPAGAAGKDGATGATGADGQPGYPISFTFSFGTGANAVTMICTDADKDHNYDCVPA